MSIPRVRRVDSVFHAAPVLLVVCVWAASATVASAGTGDNATVVLDESRLVDMTYVFDENTIYWPTATSFQQKVVSHGHTEAGFWYASNDFTASEHGGTHLDAPIHFAEGRWSSEQIPLQRLMGPAVVVDVTTQCEADADYRLTVSDLEAWEARHGRIPDGAIVLLRTGWGARWPDRERYFGTETPGDTSTLHFPGYSKEAAEFLTTQRRVDAVGLDTPSLDHGPSSDFVAHQVFGEANVVGLENVAQLDRLPAVGAFVLALPMKIGGGTGGPARIVGILPPSD